MSFLSWSVPESNRVYRWLAAVKQGGSEPYRYPLPSTGGHTDQNPRLSGVSGLVLGRDVGRDFRTLQARLRYLELQAGSIGLSRVVDTRGSF